ncbi:hypothetical protein ECH_0262 [Ehrlichia chaffeensis str. Arkansas]|uniref:Uncharacterized protein n=1 Tax=Ehrlichia chaffeensis (strain ATCC CRL-10679 / Arkansas) TaxID=205920 RepID=Q2GHK0_EHRCR|nr:hypothetical protein ECH_0262 [Ehrlichia chaffeensis str. Arkansas]
MLTIYVVSVHFLLLKFNGMKKCFLTKSLICVELSEVFYAE